MRAMVFTALVAAALLPSHTSLAQSAPAGAASPSAPEATAPATGGTAQAPVASTPPAGSTMAPTGSASPGTVSPGALTAAAPPQATPPTQELAVSVVIEKDLIASDGKELGDIEQVVENSADKKRYLVISSGGVLGFFEDQVVVPLDQVAVKDNEIVIRNMTEDQITSLPEFDSATYRDVGASEKLIIAEME